MKALIQTLNSLPNKSRTALITYGNRPQVVFGLENDLSSEALQKKIDSALPMGGGRRMDRALEEGAQLMKNSGQFIPKIVLLITAGRQTEVRNCGKKLKLIVVESSGVNVVREKGVIGKGLRFFIPREQPFF